MKKFFKRLLLVLLVLVLLVAASPFLIIQFGSETKATSAKMLLNAIIGYGVESPVESVVQQRMQVPDGFNVQLYAANLGKIRFMHLTESGDLLLSRPRSGDILLLERDANKDGYPDGQRVLMEGLAKPHGLDVADGWLYIAESTAIGKIQFNTETGETKGEYQRIVDPLSDEGNHWTKTVAMGPDGKLYFTSGSSCNVCEEEDPYRASMLRVSPDGSGLEIYATGLRNAVGFDWAPWDQSLYATDNGRDLLGDDFPPCELNKIEQNTFYGWPYINGFGKADPDVQPTSDDKKTLVDQARSPAHGFRAHNAPLGITFLRHNQVSGFNKTALVALHGSWNRSERDGYKVVSLQWQDDGSIVETDFLTGFKGKTDVIGRPADVVEGADGSIYISDDYSGAVYKVSFGKPLNVKRVHTELVTAEKSDPAQQLAIYGTEQLSALQLDGQQLFSQFACSQCHQLNNNQAGQSKMALRQLADRYSLTELSEFFLAPTPPMPKFPLTADQREALAVYLYQR